MTSRALANALAILVLCLAGCAKTSSEPATSSTTLEPSFVVQARAVADGKSTQIRLDRSPVNDDDLRTLAGLEDKLERLNLSRTDISDEGLRRIAQMQRLEQLRLDSHRITDQGLAELAALKQLRFLHLLHAPIGDAGLAHLHALKQLESLYLDGTKVTDDGLARLLEAVPGVHLHIDDHHHRLDPKADEHSHEAAVPAESRK